MLADFVEERKVLETKESFDRRRP